MPWKENTKMNQKVQFISQYLEDIKTTTQLAYDFGISRKTAYKWIKVVREEGKENRLMFPIPPRKSEPSQ